MISSGYSFRQFIDAVKGKNPQEIICMAEQEATEAWRASYRKRNGSGEWMKSKSYQDRLLGLIDFMRHGIKVHRFEEHELRLCRTLLDGTPGHQAGQKKRHVRPDTGKAS